jgi:hypothetical protein
MALRAELTVMLVSAVAVLVFTALKAGNSSFTHDESLTYRLYVHLSWCDLLSHAESYTNNHMLNSMAMKVTECAFGPGEFALRLPNLVALLVYLVYAALLVRPLGPVIGTLTYLCLVFAVQVIELFALARGYGLSFGFMLMALYHAWRSLVTGAWLHVVLAQVTAVLAVLSSFVLLHFVMGLAGALPMVVLLCPAEAGERVFFLRALKRHALLLPLTAALMVWPLYRVASGNGFEFGHARGIVNDTFASMMLAAFPGVSFTGAVIFGVWYAGVGLCVLLLVHALRVRRSGDLQGRWPARPPVLLYQAVLPACLLVIVLQHAILDTPYPEVRYSRYLVPLAVLFLGAVAALVARGRWQRPSVLFMFVAACASVIAFIRLSGYRTSAEWRYDMDTDRVMAMIRSDLSAPGTGTGPVRLGHVWLLEPTVNYYRQRDGIARLRPAHRNGPDYTEDYLVLPDSLLGRQDPYRYRLIGCFEHARLWLYRHE